MSVARQRPSLVYRSGRFLSPGAGGQRTANPPRTMGSIAFQTDDRGRATPAPRIEFVQPAAAKHPATLARTVIEHQRFEAQPPAQHSPCRSAPGLTIALPAG